MIVCDRCDARVRQPLPHGWEVTWHTGEGWGHLCPEHARPRPGAAPGPTGASGPAGDSTQLGLGEVR